MEEVVPMHRSVTRSMTVVALAALLAAASLPAQAKSRPKQHRGKKAIGQIVSFDEATMTLAVDLPGDEDFSGAVDPDVQVKVDHRGWAKKGASRGNPTVGSLDDLAPGSLVLRMKVEDDLVTKIRIRPGAEAALPAGDPAGDSGDHDSTEADDSDSDADDSGDDDSTEAVDDLDEDSDLDDVDPDDDSATEAG
jgi:hypothetical protein